MSHSSNIAAIIIGVQPALNDLYILFVDKNPYDFNKH